MSQQIKGIYTQNGEDPSEKILKQQILLSMIKAQQQELLIDTALDQLNKEIILVLTPKFKYQFKPD